MARRPRSAQIETRSNRLKLAVRRKPYAFAPISPGIALGYRRNAGAGTWVTRVANGKGGNWTARVGTADDYETADGDHIFDYWQAIERARRLARGKGDDAGKPATFGEAVDAYERDLRARGADAGNARRVRRHLTPTLASKPVSLLIVADLARWRDGLMAAGMKPATLTRVAKAAKAALTLAAKSDQRIGNRATWKDALSGFADSFGTRNMQVLSNQQVHDLIATAYAEDGAFGLLVETMAITGARLSQIARLAVADLQAEGDAPRLMMPSSRKGGGRRLRPPKPVPITAALADRLTAALAGRVGHAPLLLRADGSPWRSAVIGRPFARAAAAAHLHHITGYSLRHSSIVRALLAGVPARVCASNHDTSISELERTYSRYITDHADSVARRGLLEPNPVRAGKVIALREVKWPDGRRLV
jgi:integrase